MTVVIAPLRAQDTMAVVRLHRDEMSYSFNSIVGVEHLAFIYRILSGRADSHVAVASSGGAPVGVVSGTLDPGAVKRALVACSTWRDRFRLVRALATTPTAVAALWAEIAPRAPITDGDRPVRATLTAIAVASASRRMGIASRLVLSLEEFFRAHDLSSYGLETLEANAGARAFYRRSGFQEVGRSGHSLVLLKRLERHGV